MTPPSQGDAEDSGPHPAPAEPAETVLRPAVPHADAPTDTVLRRTREAPSGDATETAIRHAGPAEHSPTQTVLSGPPGPGVPATGTVLRHDLKGDRGDATSDVPDDDGAADRAPHDAVSTVVRPRPAGQPPGDRTRRGAPGDAPVEEGGTAGQSASDGEEASRSGVVLPQHSVEVPVFRPRRASRAVLVAWIVGIAVVGAVAGLVLTASPSAQPLRVEGIHIAGPGRLGCPSPVAHVRATVTVSGAGDLRYDWQLGDGPPTSLQSVNVREGQDSVSVSLAYSISLSGGGSYHGWTRLHVVEPAARTSRKVDLAVSCPP